MSVKQLLTILYLLNFYFIIGCKVIKQNSSNSGVGCDYILEFDSTCNCYRQFNNHTYPKFYYKDSLIVLEHSIDKSFEINGVIDTMYSEINYYHFVDLKTNMAINFKNFSDTSSPINVFRIRPNIDRWTAWNLYGYTQFKNFDTTSVHSLTDTIIDKVIYKRFVANSTYTNGSKQDTLFHVFFANCKPVPTTKIFQLDIAFSKKYADNCPIQIYQTYSKVSNSNFLVKFEFIRNKLTKHEIKTINAWEKYANEHQTNAIGKY